MSINNLDRHNLNSLVYCILDSYYSITEEESWGRKISISNWKSHTYHVLSDMESEQLDYVLLKLKTEDSRVYLICLQIKEQIAADTLQDDTNNEENYESKYENILSKIKKFITNFINRNKNDKLDDIDDIDDIASAIRTSIRADIGAWM